MRGVEVICEEIRRTPHKSPNWPYLMEELKEANELLFLGGFEE